MKLDTFNQVIGFVRGLVLPSIMASSVAENCQLGTEEMHCGWLVKSPPLERTATTILKAVRTKNGYNCITGVNGLHSV